MTTLETDQSLTISDTEAVNSEPVARYVVVGVYQNRYGICTDSTIELMGSEVSQITRVPHSPKYISGVINHRGSIIPVINTRLLLGFGTIASEIKETVAMLEKREQEHVEWIEELRRCVELGETITKLRDQNMCAFGKWHNEIMGSETRMLQLTKGDSTLRGLIEQFGTPHKRIYALADKVLDLTKSGEHDRAMEIINNAWDIDLSSMRALFAKTRDTISKSNVSMMIITEIGSRKAALLVDAVHTVKDVPLSAIEPLPESADNHHFLKGLVHEDGGSYVLVTDLETIYDTACPAELAAEI